MLSLATIQQLSDDIAQKAAREERRPYVPFDEAEIEEKRFSIPNIGSYEPPGWELIDTAFCDKTGWGSPYEPARTLRQYQDWLIDTIDEHSPATVGFASIEEGQFQIVVGAFRRTVA